MEFELMKTPDLTSQLSIDNAMIIVSGGLAYVCKLPDYGKTEISIVTADNKVKYIDEKKEKKIKF